MGKKSARLIGTIVCGAFVHQIALAQQAEVRSPPSVNGQTIEVNGSVEPLIMTKPPRPKYPREANGVAGWVRVECLVSPNGRIQEVRVVESQPTGVFDQAAIDAMKRAKFKPFKSTSPRLMVQRLIFSPD